MSKGRIIALIIKWVIIIAWCICTFIFIHNLFWHETDWSTSFRGGPGTVYVREAEDGTLHRYKEGENGELYEINDNGERISVEVENNTNAVDDSNAE